MDAVAAVLIVAIVAGAFVALVGVLERSDP